MCMWVCPYQKPWTLCYLLNTTWLVYWKYCKTKINILRKKKIKRNNFPPAPPRWYVVYFFTLYTLVKSVLQFEKADKCRRVVTKKVTRLCSTVFNVSLWIMNQIVPFKKWPWILMPCSNDSTITQERRQLKLFFFQL